MITKNMSVSGHVHTHTGVCSNQEKAFAPPELEHWQLDVDNEKGTLTPSKTSKSRIHGAIIQPGFEWSFMWL